jgi:hypothetical protein
MNEARYVPATDSGPTLSQLIVREVNLEIFKLASRADSGHDLYSFVCECGEPHCQRTIALHLHRFDPRMPAGSLLAHVPDGEREPLT